MASHAWRILPSRPQRRWRIGYALRLPEIPQLPELPFAQLGKTFQLSLTFPDQFLPGLFQFPFLPLQTG